MSLEFMRISYNPFLSRKAGAACLNIEFTELLKFWTENLNGIDTLEREKPSLSLLLEN